MPPTLQGIKSLHSTSQMCRTPKVHSSSRLLELPLGITPSGFVPLGGFFRWPFSVYFIIFFKGGE